MSDHATAVGSTFIWHECNVPDAAAAKAFYTNLLGWGTSDMDMGPMGTYTMFMKGEQAIGGIMPTVGDMADVPPHWSIYIAVDDVDAKASQAESLGAKIVVPAFDVPTVGRMALVSDPQGAHFWLYKAAEM
jgi:predicted enzyme related to lactoylglutathione lyase